MIATLILLISIFVGLLAGSLDGLIVKYRKATGNTEKLKHDSRLAIRLVFSFFMGLIGLVYNHHLPNHNLLLLAYTAISFFGTVLFFDLAYNNEAGNDWDYMSSGKGAATWDRLVVWAFGEDAGVASLLLKFIGLCLSVIGLLILVNIY